MKRLVYIFSAVLLAFSCADLSEYENEIDQIEVQVEELRRECAAINERIAAMQLLVSELQARETITGVSEMLDEQGRIVGYVITFKNADTITIDLSSGSGDVNISIKQDADGWWWTLNGEYMLDAQGNKMPASLAGCTPLLKVEDGGWYVSVDGGKTWDFLAVAGEHNVSALGVASVTKGEDGVTITMTDGSSYLIPMSEVATLSLPYSVNVVPGVSASVTYTFTSSTGVANVSVFGNRYIGKVSVNHCPQHRNGTINVEINENYPVSQQKVYVYLDYGTGTLTKVLTFTEKGVFEVGAVAPLPSSGGDFDLNIDIAGYYGYYIQILSGLDWLQNTGGTTFTASANAGSSARVAEISVEARDQWNSSLFAKKVYIVQFGTGSFPCYEEYAGLWKLNGSDKVMEVRLDYTRDRGYKVTGLEGTALTAEYNQSTGAMEISSRSYTFKLSSDKNTMTSNYSGAAFQRQGVSQYYNNGDVVMLNKATAGYTPLNIVILGDGYQQKDLRQGGKFEKSARSAMNSFFAIEPFKSFKDRFDVYMLTYASKDEGTDVTSSGIYKDTYFSSVCAGGGNTLVTCDYQAVLNAVTGRTGLTEANYGLYRTVVILLVNTTEQSGTCWYSKQGKEDASKVGDGIKSYAIAMLAADTMGASGLVKHEGGGHAFGRLADEYNWGGTADEAKKQSLRNEQNNYGFYWNVSSTTGLSSPWAHFIGLSGYGDVGYYEGAWGCSTGLYRPTENSIMLNNQGNFNAPSREIIYKRIILQSEGDGSYSFERFLEYDKRNL